MPVDNVPEDLVIVLAKVIIDSGYNGQRATGISNADLKAKHFPGSAPIWKIIRDLVKQNKVMLDKNGNVIMGKDPRIRRATTPNGESIQQRGLRIKNPAKTIEKDTVSAVINRESEISKEIAMADVARSMQLGHFVLQEFLGAARLAGYGGDLERFLSESVTFFTMYREKVNGLEKKILDLEEWLGKAIDMISQHQRENQGKDIAISTLRDR